VGAGKRGGRNGTPRLGGVGTNVPFGQRRRVMELVGRHCRQRGLEIGVRFFSPVCLKKGGAMDRQTEQVVELAVFGGPVRCMYALFY